MAKAEFCHICGQPCKGPINFLLTCTSCSKGYHHRCCNPPVHDQIMASMLRTSHKPGKGINAWKCRACELGKNAAQSHTAGASGASSSSRPTNISSKQPIIIDLIDDSDDETIAPPAKRPLPASAASDTALKRRTIEQDESTNRASTRIVPVQTPPAPPPHVNDAIQGGVPPVATQDLAWWRAPGGQPPRPTPVTPEIDAESSSGSDDIEAGQERPRHGLHPYRSNSRRRNGTPAHLNDRLPQRIHQHRENTQADKRQQHPRKAGSEGRSMTMDVEPHMPTPPAPVANYRIPDVRAILQESIALGRHVFDDSLREVLEQPQPQQTSESNSNSPTTPANQQTRVVGGQALPTPASLPPRVPAGLGHRAGMPSSDNLLYRHGKLANASNSRPASNSSTTPCRKPRKSSAKKLPSSRFDWAPSQRPYCFDAREWMAKEFGKDLTAKFERLSVHPVHMHKRADGPSG